jgi:hypothetical protein
MVTMFSKELQEGSKGQDPHYSSLIQDLLCGMYIMTGLG